MSIHLRAVRLIVTTGLATAMNHGGQPFINEDCPIGTFLAYDEEDNPYIFKHIDMLFTGSVDEWPEVEGDHIPLFRDYWKYVASGPNTPYGEAMRMAPHVVLRQA